VTTGAVHANAQTTTEPIAQRFFDEGRELMLQERYVEACDRFKESHRLDPEVGTLLNLALCHEHQGKLATAYVEYNDALAVALRVQDTERVELARSRLQALKPRISQIVVTPHEQDAALAIGVELDGAPLSAAVLGDPIPVDRGDHEIVVTAEGRRDQRHVIRIDREGITLPIRLAKLARVEGTPPIESATEETNTAPPLAVSPTTPSVVPDRRSRAASIATGAALGAGLVSLVLGSYFGVDAFRAWSERDRECKDGCTEEAVRSAERAERSARLSTGLFVIGVTSAGTGLGLWYATQAQNSPRNRSAGADAYSGATVVFLRGTF
jgi:hypothetical protein